MQVKCADPDFTRQTLGLPSRKSFLLRADDRIHRTCSARPHPVFQPNGANQQQPTLRY